MILFNLYGVLILCPSIGLSVFIMSFFEEHMNSYGINEGLGVGIVFLLIFFIASLSALLFDRCDKQGIVGCYKQLWAFIYHGKKSHPKTRVALFFMPLALGPFSCILVGMSIWVISAIKAESPIDSKPYITYLCLGVICIVISIIFAYITKNIRLIQPKIEQND